MALRFIRAREVSLAQIFNSLIFVRRSTRAENAPRQRRRNLEQVFRRISRSESICKHKILFKKYHLTLRYIIYRISIWEKFTQYVWGIVQDHRRPEATERDGSKELRAKKTKRNVSNCDRTIQFLKETCRVHIMR